MRKVEGTNKTETIDREAKMLETYRFQVDDQDSENSLK